MLADLYRNLLFDFGNVLIDLDIPLTFERIKAMVKRDASEEVINQAVMKYETGEISTDIFINTLLSQCPPDVQALDIIEAWNSMLIGIPAYRFEMLTMLSQKYNLYMLSNTNELHLEWIQRYLKKHHAIDDFEKRYFDDVYYSHLVGYRKPNASIFEHVIEDANLTPSLTLFMDDVQENIDAASKLGFGTYLVKEKEEIAEFLKKEGFY